MPIGKGPALLPLKKQLNGPALPLHAVRPGTVACSVKARARIVDRVYR